MTKAYANKTFNTFVCSATKPINYSVEEHSILHVVNNIFQQSTQYIVAL